MADPHSVAGSTRSGIRLQTRLMLLVLLISGAALLAVGAALPVALGRWLLQDKDTELSQAAQQFAIGQIPQSAVSGVRSPIGLVFVDAGGQRFALIPAGSDPQAYEHLPMNVGAGVTTLPADDDHPRLRAVGFLLPQGGFGYFWIPLTDVSATVTRVVLLEVAASALILTVLCLLTRRVLRRQLSPLIAITATARENSLTGSRDRAVLTAAAPEVIDLRDAFNSMLDTVDASTDAQSRTETKLRRFITDASHELRTPLAAILGYGEMYQRGMITEPVAVSTAVNTIVVEANRMRDLVTAFLSLTDEQPPQQSALRAVDVGQLAADVARKSMIRSPYHRIEVETDHDAIILGDEARLRQAITAVLDNIQQHAPTSVLTILNVGHTDGCIVLTIDDDGPGVPPEALSHLFDRFYRTDPSRNRRTGGAGLGLAIVLAITQTHHGSATAGPSPLGGLRIRLTFPSPASQPMGRPRTTSPAS
jgi:two-component system OmpR family sensor kinase